VVTACIIIHRRCCLLVTRMRWTVLYVGAFAPAYQTVHLVLVTTGRSICSCIPDSPPHPCHQQAGAYAPAYQTVNLILSPAGSIAGALYHKLLTQSSAPEDARNYRPKHVELIEIISKPLLLHLFGCLFYCITDALSH